MNSIQKNVLILGYNKAISSLLIDKLLQKFHNIQLIDFDGFEQNEVIFPRISLGRVVAYNHKSVKTIIKKADIVINTLLCPTPSNLTTHKKRKISFLEQLFTSGQLNNKYVINIFPIVNTKLKTKLVTQINQLYDLSKKLPHFVNIYSGNIFSKNDSLLSDLYTSMYAYKKFPNKYVSNTIYYTSTLDLVNTIENNLEKQPQVQEIFVYQSNTVNIKTLIATLQLIDNPKFAIGKLRNICMLALQYIGYYKLNTFNKEYLHTILLATPNKPSKIKIIFTARELVKQYYSGNIYSNIDYRYDMD